MATVRFYTGERYGSTIIGVTGDCIPVVLKDNKYAPDYDKSPLNDKRLVKFFKENNYVHHQHNGTTPRGVLTYHHIEIWPLPNPEDAHAIGKLLLEEIIDPSQHPHGVAVIDNQNTPPGRETLADFVAFDERVVKVLEHNFPVVTVE